MRKNTFSEKKKLILSLGFKPLKCLNTQRIQLKNVNMLCKKYNYNTNSSILVLFGADLVDCIRIKDKYSNKIIK